MFSRRVGAAELAHELVGAHSAGDDLAHLVVAARRVGLLLRAAAIAVGQQGAVGRAHRAQPLTLGRGGGRGAEGVLEVVVAVLDGGQEQPLLGAEEAEGVGLGDADLVGDRADCRAVQAGREVLHRGRHERVPPGTGGLAGAGGVFVGMLDSLVSDR